VATGLKVSIAISRPITIDEFLFAFMWFSSASVHISIFPSVHIQIAEARARRVKQQPVGRRSTWSLAADFKMSGTRSE